MHFASFIQQPLPAKGLLLSARRSGSPEAESIVRMPPFPRRDPPGDPFGTGGSSVRRSSAGVKPDWIYCTLKLIDDRLRPVGWKPPSPGPPGCSDAPGRPRAAGLSLCGCGKMPRAGPAVFRGAARPSCCRPTEGSPRAINTSWEGGRTEADSQLGSRRTASGEAEDRPNATQHEGPLFPGSPAFPRPWRWHLGFGRGWPLRLPGRSPASWLRVQPRFSLPCSETPEDSDDLGFSGVSERRPGGDGFWTSGLGAARSKFWSRVSLLSFWQPDGVASWHARQSRKRV